MSFLPIADAGIPFLFGSATGASMVGSVVSATNVDDCQFDLTLLQHPTATFRVTCLNYVVSIAPDMVARFSTINGGDSLETLNTGGLATFSPSPFTQVSYIDAGEAYLTYTGAIDASPLQETFAFLIEVWVDPAEGLDFEATYGQNSRAYVSGYQRNRIHYSQLFSYETGPLVADFNGAMKPGRVITSALWQTWNGSNVIMSEPAASEDFRKVGIKITAQIGGFAIIKCSATLDNGQVLVQQFQVNVQWAPVYYPANWIIGPQSVEWVAP